MAKELTFKEALRAAKGMGENTIICMVINGKNDVWRAFK